jgi:hypothetical protein
MTFRPDDFDPPPSRMRSVASTIMVILACVLLLYWLSFKGRT